MVKVALNVDVYSLEKGFLIYEGLDVIKRENLVEKKF